ncbi:MAG: hypothetical protein ACK4IX_01145, partial [Candidatus Sericytochromatia bacterium]
MIENIKIMEKEYTALLYENTSAHGKNALVKLSENKIIINSNDEEIILDSSKAEFTLSGENSKYLLIKEHSHSILVDSVSIIQDLINNTDTSLHIKLLKIKSDLDKLNIKRKSTPIFISLVIISFVLGSWFLLKFSFNYISDLIVSKIPVEYEKKLGNVALKQFISGKEVGNKNIKSAIEEIGNQLASKSNSNQYKFKF